MPERLRKLPKLPELTELQALLLIGGAFVFGVLLWSFGTLDVFVDRTASAPEEAVLAATIDRTDPAWAEFQAQLPEEARTALDAVAAMKSVTLYAVPGPGKGWRWGTLEDGRNSLRLVPKGTDAVGFVVLDGRRAPFAASVGSGVVQARVGRGYRGPAFTPNPFAAGRRLIAPFQGQTAYVEKPAGVFWNQAASELGGLLQRFQPQASLWSLPGRLELSASASGSDSLNPFVLYYRPEYGHSLSGPALEDYGKALLAEADPVGTKILLPDDTSMIELRRDPEAVQIARKPVGTFGERAQLSIPGGDHKVEIFYADDGEAWMSGTVDQIQAAIMGAVGVVAPSGTCEQGGTHGFAAFEGKNQVAWPYFEGMRRLTFSIHNIETGLFTICGYFGT